jgi:hypothetical protein
MAEPARTRDLEPAPTPARPRLDVVGDDHAGSTDHAPTDGAGIGRSAIVGAAVGFLVVTIGVTVAGTLGGIGFGASLGLGAFVGMWGGAGFGFMMGGTIPAAATSTRSAPLERTTTGKEHPSRHLRR